MSGRTAFEIALPGPSLDNPILFERHARRVEEWMKGRYPTVSGYRVTRHEEKDGSRRTWEVRVDRGWFTGAKAVIKPDKVTPHRATIDVVGESRLERALLTAGIVAMVPVALLLLVVGTCMLGRLLFALIAVGVLFFVWAIAVSLVSMLVAGVMARIFGNEFGEDRRIEMAGYIQALPLVTQLEPNPPAAGG